MSLAKSARPRAQGGFPRVSGDEPVGSELWASRDAFSPRERG